MAKGIVKITEHTPDSRGYDRWKVLSESGATYIVTYEGCGDGDAEYVALWSCTCPAHLYAKPDADICKHVAAVAKLCDDLY